MEILVESTVSARIRHSDSAPIASEAATAFLRRDEATGAVRLLKPFAPGDRIMSGIPYWAGESPAQRNVADPTGNITAAAR